MKSKRFFYILFLMLNIFLSIFNLKAQNFSSKSQISILTVSPGKEVYNAFGHSAIRINDTINKVDRIFNYGIFNFNAPNFTLNFIKGKLLYQLGVSSTKNFKRNYEYQNRQIFEQIINLNETENKKIIDFLVNNYKPENRKYLYDFFYDNCSSRIRDVLQSQLPNLKINNKPLKLQGLQKSFRQYLDVYTYNNGRKWTDFGMDLILGSPADANCDKLNQMYLPDFLMNNLKTATNNNKLLLQPAKIILPFSKKPLAKKTVFPPIFATCILLFLALIISVAIKSKKAKNIFDISFFGILAFAGIIFLIMWLFTDHVVCHKNFNLIWANPIYIIGLIFFFNKKIFWQIAAIVVGLLLILFPFVSLNLHPFAIIPQQMHLAFVPILLTIILRCFFKFKFEIN